ncbi:PREDICTED: uncharacterized protein LOC106749454 [Dinoponera quadriceps]|uniref:Uncharacterized protein LOC106749454 n=1 Tax=Dinoponera quadriceps TaxID=609295 RepID=A0A6P3Y0P7_DINQU|nr:PREDICTED: uncharacterized protein LOC106749454 [Dinoponera quadriceps]
MSVTRYSHDRLLQCTATYPLEKRSPEEYRSFEMHPRALHVLVLAVIAVVRAGCDDKIKWYSGLRSMLKNCPTELRNSSGQDEILETFRRCVQRRIVDTLDALLDENVISVFDGIDLVRFHLSDENSTEHKDNLPDGSFDDISWSEIIWNRLTRVLRTHAFKVDVDHIFNTTSATNNTSESDPNSNIVQGRRRRHRRKHHFMPMMMLGLLFMGSVVIPMGFQFLAVLGGKALVLAKMALILSSIQGLKKIATSGINYGLYHHSPEAWHDRSHQVFPEEDYPVYVPSHP